MICRAGARPRTGSTTTSERELTSAIVGIMATPIPDAAMPCSAW